MFGDRGSKGRRLAAAVLALATALTLALSGCGSESESEGLPRPEFPLTEAALTEAQERAGVPGRVAEDETRTGSEGDVLYTLHSDVDGGQSSVGVMSADVDGKRMLQITSILPPAEDPRPFIWEDQKPFFTFAALLYGGFEHEESLYEAFRDQDVTTPISWEAELPGGYCRVGYSFTGLETKPFPLLTIFVYGSQAEYQEFQEMRRS